MPVSKLHKECLTRISNVLVGVVVEVNIRPEWMRSENGTRLEIDIYIPDYGIGVEIQGQQHAEFIEHFHRDSDGFARQVSRDRQKKELCEMHGIDLYEVWSINDIEPVIDAVQVRIMHSLSLIKVPQIDPLVEYHLGKFVDHLHLTNIKARRKKGKLNANKAAGGKLKTICQQLKMPLLVLLSKCSPATRAAIAQASETIWKKVDERYKPSFEGQPEFFTVYLDKTERRQQLEAEEYQRFLKQELKQANKSLQGGKKYQIKLFPVA